MISPNAMLHDMVKPVSGLPPITPSSSTPDYVNMKNYERVCVIIHVDNGAIVTGSAITLLQATAVAGTGEKALAFTKAYRNIDLAAADALAEFAVTNNTFTTDTTDAKNLMYVIEIDSSDLDLANGFDCFRVGTADGANMVLSVLYLLYPSRYSSMPSAILD